MINYERIHNQRSDIFSVFRNIAHYHKFITEPGNDRYDGGDGRSNPSRGNCHK